MSIDNDSSSFDNVEEDNSFSNVVGPIIGVLAVLAILAAILAFLLFKRNQVSN
jgi:hypothetical protein